MLRLVAGILVFGACISFSSAMQAAPSREPVVVDESVTIFFTGNELGVLRPCGCSGGQLGGFDRRWSVLSGVDRGKRLIVDTGSFVDDFGEQDMFKFQIIAESLGLLEYDVVNLSGEDVETALNLGLVDSFRSLFEVISSAKVSDVNIPTKFSKEFSLNGKSLNVTVATAAGGSVSKGKIKELFGPPVEFEKVNVLILDDCDGGVVESIRQMGIVDCLVCPPESDEPGLIGEGSGGMLVFSPGRFGKYVGRLEIKADGKGRLKLDFSSVAVSEDLSKNDSLSLLYENYKELVGAAGLLESHPRFSLDGGLEYVGSDSCQSCHEYEYEKWSSQGHAHAYATLEKENSNQDPECVVCHTVGFDYESGFVSTAVSGEGLANVGCENCHGPGSKHIESGDEFKSTAPMIDCVDCHNPDNSGGFAGNESKYFEKIIHWREPNNADNVKKKEDSQK